MFPNKEISTVGLKSDPERGGGSGRVRGEIRNARVSVHVPYLNTRNTSDVEADAPSCCQATCWLDTFILKH